MDQAQQLRNIIKQQNMKKHLARVMTVTSGKGGVGKSNVAVNLGIQLSKIGKRVVILDADFGLANVEVMLGVRPKYNLADMMCHGKSLRDIISPGPENIGFISGGSGMKELTNLDKDQIQDLLRAMYELDCIADVIIIDTGAGISNTVTDLVASSSEVILVATPEPTSITDAYALLKTLCRNPEFISQEIEIRMIANRTGSYEEGHELYEKLNSVVKRFLKMKMEYCGMIPYDGFMPKAVMRQKPVSVLYPNAPSSRAMLDLAMVLDNKKEIQDDIVGKKGLSGVLSRMFNNYKIRN